MFRSPDQVPGATRAGGGGGSGNPVGAEGLLGGGHYHVLWFPKLETTQVSLDTRANGM